MGEIIYVTPGVTGKIHRIPEEDGLLRERDLQLEQEAQPNVLTKLINFVLRRSSVTEVTNVVPPERLVEKRRDKK